MRWTHGRLAARVAGLVVSLLAIGGAAAAQRAPSQRPAPPLQNPRAVLPPANAVIDPTLTIGGQQLKAREVETRLSVDVRVNGQGPYHFLVDSGADSSAIGLRIARDLQLPLSTPVILNGTTSREIVDRVKVDSLALGSSVIRNLDLPALREGDVGGDGLIGIDALVEQRLLLDFDHHWIKVEDARVPIRSLPGEIVIVARKSRGQLILTEVSAAGFPLSAVIDTGSEISIGNSALRNRLMRYNPDKFWTTTAIGVTGVPVKLQLARIDYLQIGPITLENVPIAFADVLPFELFGLSHEPSLLLGTDVLQTFRRVSLDFRTHRVRFQLRTCKAQGIVISTMPENAFTRVTTTGGLEVCGP